MNARIDVPMLDLQTQHAAIREEIDAAIARVIDSGRFVLGDEVEGFEREFARYCRCPTAVGCASGSDALLLALMACGIEPGDEVICPSYSFFATASAIVRLGARPVFADIDPECYTLDPAHVLEVAAGCSRLRAILPVDLFGQACDVDAFLALSRDLGVPVIEDAAQSVGARDCRDAMAGTRAKIGCFSLYPTKNLGAMGDAGILISSDTELAEKIGSLRVHGARARYLHTAVGINSRLDALQAAVLRVKLGHLEDWTKARCENAAFYDHAFASAGAGTSAEVVDQTSLPLLTPSPPTPPARHVYHQYVVRVRARDRDALQSQLRSCGIASACYYPIGLHQQPCFASLRQRAAPLPHTEAAANETLALPVHPTLERSQLEYVVDRVLALLAR